MADKQTVGFIGVGLMGHGMARNYYAVAMANGGDAHSQHMPMLTDFVCAVNGIADDCHA